MTTASNHYIYEAFNDNSLNYYGDTFIETGFNFIVSVHYTN